MHDFGVRCRIRKQKQKETVRAGAGRAGSCQVLPKILFNSMRPPDSDNTNFACVYMYPCVS